MSCDWSQRYELSNDVNSNNHCINNANQMCILAFADTASVCVFYIRDLIISKLYLICCRLTECLIQCKRWSSFSIVSIFSNDPCWNLSKLRVILMFWLLFDNLKTQYGSFKRKLR